MKPLRGSHIICQKPLATGLEPARMTVGGSADGPAGRKCEWPFDSISQVQAIQSKTTHMKPNQFR